MLPSLAWLMRYSGLPRAASSTSLGDAIGPVHRNGSLLRPEETRLPLNELSALGMMRN